MFAKGYAELLEQNHTIFLLTFGILYASKTVRETSCFIERPKLRQEHTPLCPQADSREPCKSHSMPLLENA